MKITEQIKNEICRRSYIDYVEYIHEGRFIKGKAVEYICNRVQDFVERKTGNAYDILVISMPPQHGKSMCITETLPSWYLGNNPYKRVIEISYNEDFAQTFGRKNKIKLEQAKKIFNVNLGTPSNNTELVLENNVGGMISRGVLSGVTGKPRRPDDNR